MMMRVIGLCVLVLPFLTVVRQFRAWVRERITASWQG